MMNQQNTKHDWNKRLDDLIAQQELATRAMLERLNTLHGIKSTPNSQKHAHYAYVHEFLDRQKQPCSDLTN